MPKQLVLVRHGKAAHGSTGQSDFDRELKASGQTDAMEMALKFKKEKFFPDLLISSPAARALATAVQFAKVWDLPAEAIETNIAVYEADTKSLFDVVMNIEDSFDKVALFGHNPGLSDLVSYLTGTEYLDLPTSAVVWIEFPVEEWKDISQHTGTILIVDYPKS
jgi:phosphohistidine phosphatase